MTHHHLALELLNSFKSNTDHNYDRSTAERYVQAVGVSCLAEREGGDLGEDYREERNNAQKEGTKKGDPADDLADIP